MSTEPWRGDSPRQGSALILWLDLRCHGTTKMPLFTGQVDHSTVVVPATSAACVQRCERLGLRAVPVDTEWRRSEFVYQKGALFDDSVPTGITRWYEKRDPERLASARGRRDREHRDADDRRRRELAWRQADAQRHLRRMQAHGYVSDPPVVHGGWDHAQARARLLACHARARRACGCVSCVGADRVESVVAREHLERYHGDELPGGLLMKISLVLDEFVAEAVEKLNAKSTVPQDDVERVCAKARAKALKKIDDAVDGASSSFSSSPHNVGMSASPREKVEHDLDTLRHFIVRWNASKGIRFKSSGSAALKFGIPGDAIVVGVDDTEIRRYLNAELAEQHAVFGRHKCVFMKKLSEAAQHAVHELFQFNGLRYDAIAERATPKLSGSSGSVCKFEIEHSTSVREKSPRSAYPLLTAETELGFSLQQRNVQSAKEETVWNWTLGAPGGVNASVGGSMGSILTSTWQHASTMTGSTQGHCVTVDMTVRNETRAWLSAHTVSSIMTAGRAKDANHETSFVCELPLQLTLHVPVHSIVSAWVTNPVSDLLSLLQGDPLARLISDGRALHIGHATDTTAKVLTAQKSAALSGYNICEDFGAALLIHPQDDAFHLSIVQKTPSAEDDATGFQPSSALWVGLGFGGRLVLSEARETFSLHRDSYRYKHWALRAHSYNAFVVRRSDGCFYAEATEPENASELVFSRASCPSKRPIGTDAPGA